MNTEKIGKFIAQKRKEKKYTQKELALKLGVTDRAVSKWERGLGCPDISLLEDLSKILDISIVELLNGESKEDIKILEKDLINSMKISKENEKNRIINNFNVILETIIIIVISMLVILNIINSIELNKKETNEFNNNITEKTNNIEKYINIIKNNKGKYSNEDYKKIIAYVNDLDKLFSKETKELLNKKEYNIKDYYEFEKYYFDNFSADYNYLNKSLYYTLIKYDTNMVDNMLKYEQIKDNLRNIYIGIVSTTSDSYKYGLKEKYLMNVNSFFMWSYINEEQLLKDIIEVGDMNV
ncbi:MAG: helix-turn-helix transcriptional regulator [Bacilli bacterium]|nr:helix-turn-helix transcriptional regulator [Bacilli bacterium]